MTGTLMQLEGALSLHDRNVDSRRPLLSQIDMPEFPWHLVDEGPQRLRKVEWRGGFMTYELLSNPGLCTSPATANGVAWEAGVLLPGHPPPQHGGGEDGVLPKRLTGYRPARASLVQVSRPTVSPCVALGPVLQPGPRKPGACGAAGQRREILDSESSRPRTSERTGRAELQPTHQRPQSGSVGTAGVSQSTEQ